MNKKFKFTSAILSAGLLITPISGLVSNYDNVAKAHNKNQDELKTLYNKLEYKNKIKFKKLKKELNLTREQQIEILKDKEIMDKQPTERWKSAAIRKVAKWIAAKVGSKSVADITDYLFEWEDDLQKGIENWLVEKTGMLRSDAYWIAKTAMFIAF